MKTFKVGYKPRARREVYRNTAEGEFFAFTKECGLSFIKRGWPDFHTITKSDRFICVEVKPFSFRAISYDQNTVMTRMVMAGIDCYVWSMDGGFRQMCQNGVSVERTKEEVFR